MFKHNLFFRNIEDAETTASNLNENAAMFQIEFVEAIAAKCHEDASELQKKAFAVNPLKAYIEWETKRPYTEQQKGLIHHGCSSGLASYNYNIKQ